MVCFPFVGRVFWIVLETLKLWRMLFGFGFLVCAECFNGIKTVLHLIIIWMGVFKDGLNAE